MLASKAPRSATCSARSAYTRPVSVSQPRNRILARAATAEGAEPATSEGGSKTWYACVANAEFMLNDVQNESFAEQLREKTRFYKENDYELDFFMVCEPAWLDEQHPEAAKKVGRPCVALVGTEENWIRYMKLRLDRVMFLEVTGTKEEITKCGAPVPEFERLDSSDKWIAPYSPYAPGWWSVFMPGAVDA